MIDPYDHIEEYLAGDLNGQQLTLFEKALKNDAELQALVANYSTVKNISDGLLESELIAEVTKVSHSLSNENVQPQVDHKVNKRTRIKWLVVALGAIVMALLAAYIARTYFPDSGSGDPDQLMAEVYKEPIWPAKRGSDSDEFLALGVQAFNSGEEAKAIAYLTDSVSQSMVGSYWLAELYLKEKQYEQSLKYLPTKSTNSLYQNRISYLRMINNIGLGNMEEAAKIYPQLSQDYKDLVPKHTFSK